MESDGGFDNDARTGRGYTAISRNASSNWIFMILVDQLAWLSRPVIQASILAFGGLILLRWRWYRLAAGLLLSAALWVGLCSTPAFASWMEQRLESSYVRISAESYPKADAIVVLGGGKLPPAGADWPVSPTTRLGFGLQLFRTSRAPVMLLSGEDQATKMRQRLTERGVAAGALLMDVSSVNTHQNALYSAAILKRNKMQRILLVTSGIHMPRAAASFSRQGMTVIPAPLLDRGDKWPLATTSRWWPQRRALRLSGHCLREYLGFWCYRLLGWV